MLRGIAVWLIIMAIETLSGILRGLYLVPRMGEENASRIGWPVAVLVVLVVTWALIGWTGLRRRSALLRLGAVWMALTFVFEVGIGLLRGLDVTRIWNEINPMAGGMMLYSLAVIALAPLAMRGLRDRLATQRSTKNT
jgi:hypothetical protein